MAGFTNLNMATNQSLIEQILEKQKRIVQNRLIEKTNKLRSKRADPTALPNLDEPQYTQEQQDFLNQRGSKPTPAAGNAFEAFGKGGVRGFDNLTQGFVQKIAQAMGAAGIDTSDFLDQQARTQASRRKNIEPTKKKYPKSTAVGEVVGEVAAFPYGASTGKGAVLLGGMIGGFQPTTGEAPPTMGQLFGKENNPHLQEFINNTLWGGAFGGAGHKLGEGIASLSEKGASLGKGLINKALSRFNLIAPDDAFTNGIANPRLAEYMESQGIEPDSLREAVLQEINQLPDNVNLRQATNLADAKSIGVDELTKSNITGNFEDMRQQRLLEKKGGESGDQLRTVLAKQNNQIINAGDQISKSIGEPDKFNVGYGITKSLRDDVSRRKLLISSLYDEAEEMNGAPIIVEQKGIAEAFYEQFKIYDGDPDAGPYIRKVKKTLKEFGVIPKSERFSNAMSSIETDNNVDFDADAFRSQIVNFVGEGSSVEELSVSRANELIKRINAIKSELVPKSGYALRPIRSAIDDALDAISVTEDMAEEAVDAFKKARLERTRLGQDYNQKDIVQSIVSNKVGTNNKIIHPSIVYEKIMSSQNRYGHVEVIKRALTSDKGKTGSEFDQDIKYWRDFKSTVAAELIGRGLTKGRTATGEMQYSGADFNRAMSKIGGNTLRIIFNKKELADLSRFGRVTKDLTVLPNGLFTPSGDHVENALSRLSKSGLFRISPIASTALKEGSDILNERSQKDLLEEVLNPTIEMAYSLGSYSNNAVKAFQLLAISSQSKIRDKINEDK